MNILNANVQNYLTNNKLDRIFNMSAKQIGTYSIPHMCEDGTMEPRLSRHHGTRQCSDNGEALIKQY